MAENVHTALQRSGVVERRQLDAVDPGLLLLDAEVLFGYQGILKDLNFPILYTWYFYLH